MEKDTNVIANLLDESKAELSRLLEEETKANKEKETRDISILRTKSVIDFLNIKLNGEKVVVSTSETLQQDNLVSSKAFSYALDITWVEKIKAFLKFHNKVATIAEMVDAFVEFEKPVDSKKIFSALSNVVSTMTKKNLLKIHKPPIKMKGYYYGNPTWYLSDELKEEYKPNLEKKLMW